MEFFNSPLSSLEVATSIEAYVEDVNGGVNEEGVRALNINHNTNFTIQQSIMTHLYKYESYIRC